MPENMGLTITVRQPFPISVELGDDIAHVMTYRMLDLYTIHLQAKAGTKLVTTSSIQTLGI